MSSWKWQTNIMKTKKMKTTLITGGAGFIGSHLCDFLIEKSFRVICVDNFITGNRKNIEHLKCDNNFTLIEHDISKHISIDEPVDYVMHFASPASPVDYQKIPIQTLKAGSLGTHNTLGLAVIKKAKYFLASTSEVYGDPQVNPQPESYWGNVNPVGPRGCYDEAKAFAEARVIAYLQIHNVDTRIARIFNTYGSRMRKDDGRAVPNFINQALNNKPITIYGDGKQTRSFCYVSDLVDGIYKLMMSDVNSPMNLGNPDEYTILDFAKIIQEISNTTSKIKFKNLPVDDPHIRCPDITKAIKELNWKPKMGLKEGIVKTIEWFRNN